MYLYEFISFDQTVYIFVKAYDKEHAIQLAAEKAIEEGVYYKIEDSEPIVIADLAIDESPGICEYISKI